MKPIRVLIADDEPTIREALSELIAGEESLELVGAAEDADQAIDLARTLQPDVALLDVRMPAGGGPRAAKEIQACAPQTRVVALSAYEDQGSVLQMVQLGAVGYLVKGSLAEDILETIHQAARGHGALSPEVVTQVVHEPAGQLGRQERELEQRRTQVERIRRALKSDALTTVYQPIVGLHSGRIHGMEAFAGFSTEPQRLPNLWLLEAAAVGLGVDLELAAVRAALTQLDRLPADAFLSVNVSPGTVVSPRFLEVLAGVPGKRIVIEVTEHAPVEDYTSLKDALARLRARGVRLAVDDAGAGYASIQHILRLSPDFIKLDMPLTRGINADEAHQALAAALISSAERFGAGIIAEGIETRAEMEALLSLGITCGQGYHLAPPGPLPPHGLPPDTHLEDLTRLRKSGGEPHRNHLPERA